MGCSPTQGLVSLDKAYVQIISRCGDANQKRMSKKVAWYVEHHHLTLVTLLLANAAAVRPIPASSPRPQVLMIDIINSNLLF